MNYTYEIKKDEYLDLVIAEYLDNKKNAQWEISYILKQDLKNPVWEKTSLERIYKWLQKNNPELLL
jgi:hypothetical protein